MYSVPCFAPTMMLLCTGECGFTMRVPGFIFLKGTIVCIYVFLKCGILVNYGLPLFYWSRNFILIALYWLVPGTIELNKARFPVLMSGFRMRSFNLFERVQYPDISLIRVFEHLYYMSVCLIVFLRIWFSNGCVLYQFSVALSYMFYKSGLISRCLVGLYNWRGLYTWFYIAGLYNGTSTNL